MLRKCKDDVSWYIVSEECMIVFVIDNDVDF